MLCMYFLIMNQCGNSIIMCYTCSITFYVDFQSFKNKSEQKSTKNEVVAESKGRTGLGLFQTSIAQGQSWTGLTFLDTRPGTLSYEN